MLWKKELRAIALTDHDTMDGIEEAMEAAEGTLLEVIPGIELSTTGGGRMCTLWGWGLTGRTHISEKS